MLAILRRGWVLSKTIDNRRQTADSWDQQARQQISAPLLIHGARPALPHLAERDNAIQLSAVVATLPADQLGHMIRDHWSIENSVHRVLELTFRDDECRIRTNKALPNFLALRHRAHHLVRKAPAKLHSPQAQSRRMDEDSSQA